MSTGRVRPDVASMTSLKVRPRCVAISLLTPTAVLATHTHPCTLHVGTVTHSSLKPARLLLSPVARTRVVVGSPPLHPCSLWYPLHRPTSHASSQWPTLTSILTFALRDGVCRRQQKRLCGVECQAVETPSLTRFTRTHSVVSSSRV
jgi:hypothetical protein